MPRKIIDIPDIKISEETMAKIDALPNIESGNHTAWTAEKDAVILEYYEKWVKTVYFQEGEEKYRGDLVISLLNESHEPVVSWKAINAYITKIQATDFKADGNEIAIETAEFVHEKLTMIE